MMQAEPATGSGAPMSQMERRQAWDAEQFANRRQRAFFAQAMDEPAYNLGEFGFANSGATSPSASESFTPMIAMGPSRYSPVELRVSDSQGFEHFVSPGGYRENGSMFSLPFSEPIRIHGKAPSAAERNLEYSIAGMSFKPMGKATRQGMDLLIGAQESAVQMVRSTADAAIFATRLSRGDAAAMATFASGTATAYQNVSKMTVGQMANAVGKAVYNGSLLGVMGAMSVDDYRGAGRTSFGLAAGAALGAVARLGAVSKGFEDVSGLRAFPTGENTTSSAAKISFETRGLNPEGLDPHLLKNFGNLLASDPVAHAALRQMQRIQGETGGQALLHFTDGPPGLAGRVTSGTGRAPTMDIFMNNSDNISARGAASTFVHESSHFTRASRGSEIGTQLDEYMAFRRELLFELGRRPTILEKQNLWLGKIQNDPFYAMRPVGGQLPTILRGLGN